MNYLVARVSDVNQRKALPAQKKKLFEYSERNAWKDKIDFIYVEYDETAFKEDRKKFRELVIEPLQAETDLAIVVFDKIDRFSRDTSSEDRRALTKLFRQGKIEMHFPSDNLFISKDSPASDLFRLDIGIALAAYYSSAIRDNVKRRFDEMVSNKTWIGKAPIGYQNYVSGYDGKGDPIKDIRFDEERKHHIIEGFKLRSAGMSYAAIAKDRKKEGLLGTKRRNKYGKLVSVPLGKAKWEEIINNPFYMGEMRYMGKQYPHKYPVLIESWLWFKCQQVNRERSHARTKYDTKPFLFKKLKCHECGRAISFDGPKGPGGNIYGRCTQYDAPHGAKNVKEKDLIEQVKVILESITIPKEMLPELVAEIEKHHENEQEYYQRHKKALQEEYERLDNDIKELFGDRKQFHTRMDIFDSMVKEKGERQKSILKEIEAHGEGDKAFVIGASYILEVASRAVELFESESSKLEQKRYLLDVVLSNATLDGEKLRFNLNKPFDGIVNMKKSGEWCQLSVVFRKEYYGIISGLANQVELARILLGTTLAAPLTS